jgi:hypothetical protein
MSQRVKKQIKQCNTSKNRVYSVRKTIISMFQFIPAILALINLVSGVATVVDVVKTVTKKPEPEPAPEPEPEPEPEPLPEPDDLEISWEPNKKYTPTTTNQKTYDPTTNADLIYLRKKWAQIRQQRQRERQQRPRQPQTTYAMISKPVKRKQFKS